VHYPIAYHPLRAYGIDLRESWYREKESRYGSVVQKHSSMIDMNLRLDLFVSSAYACSRWPDLSDLVVARASGRTECDPLEAVNQCTS
jgi:hypothetical protein